jgi:hypothetical protein
MYAKTKDESTEKALAKMEQDMEILELTGGKMIYGK